MRKTGIPFKKVVLNGGILVCLVASAEFLTARFDSATDPSPQPVAGHSSASQLETAYSKWSESYSKTNPAGPVVSIQYNRGLSSEPTKAKGIAQFDFERDKLSVRVQQLNDPAVSHVWLVDNIEGEGRSVIPESGDNFLYAGQLTVEDDGSAWLDANIEQLESFPLDMVVLARSPESPANNSVALGTVSLFQEMFHYPDRANTAVAQQSGPSSILGIESAQATSGITPPGFFAGVSSDLINRGRRLFFRETFNGNGRTCGTCHREEDNLALGIDTIAKLPANDPLFIVEQEFRADGTPNPLYNEFRFEKPELMRKLGLIVENLNGFREPDGSFTERINMRAPQHVLSMNTSLAPPPAFADDGTLPVNPNDLEFAERTGWSGDGTPTGFREDFFQSNGRELTGSLRDFTVGAVIQHFPLTMERSAFSADENGNPRTPDFRFPTEAELDAMEAFMLSTGQLEPKDDLNSLGLVDEVADRGRLNYMGFNVFDATPDDGRPPLNCNACHFNGSAMTNPEFPFPSAVTPNHDLADLAANGGSIPSHNRSFSPGAERLADQAPDIIVQVSDHPSVAGDCFDLGLAEIPLLPGDSPDAISAGCSANPLDNGFAFGIDDPFADQRIVSDRFNAPAVFEAVDTPPFFHGHQIDTIEGAVAFYAANRHMRNGEFLGAIVPLNAPQIINVARFLRVMGADFNADSAITLLRKAQGFSYFDDYERRLNVRLAAFEVQDALQLLRPVNLHITDAQPKLRRALRVLRSSGGTSDDGLRRAIRLLTAAQNSMVVRS